LNQGFKIFTFLLLSSIYSVMKVKLSWSISLFKVFDFVVF